MKTSQAHVVISIDKTLFTFVYERSIYNVASDVTSYESYVKTVVRSIKGQRWQTSENSPYWTHRSRLTFANNRKRDFRVTKMADKC